MHATLVKEILDGTLAAGTPLSERSLVNRFMISRTPIRHVLWQLERDDLIEMHPHRGAFVKKLGFDDVMRNLLHGTLGSEWVSFREHVAILEAIERRDAPAARHHMAAHLRRAREAVLEHLFG